ncbi:hypothetical protein P153DRAFT_303566 [Dothidotthia symphoricarpi CBS 119687]|uniref:DUF7924 domain-containing protein n=1 Tax=Dothidotthia symphoricarpi CBS 119687 TaxID=1392245 RepID=A0A6A5ZZD4_9PLEO|nr:uncharacterized protein P153DRAFT_303566 [Dothidotthia symphoricarpi CBS 119687]KAF2123681.1 hypothetical protein P153DRAFT_303566 [Dothidotthia symphoricarpi CBS 119687]
MTVPRNPSPTRNASANADRKQLAGYNITVDKEIALPRVLAEFVDTLKRSRDVQPSPHAQMIVDTRRAASVENEILARQMLAEHVLFRGEAYNDGIKGLTLKDQVNLVKAFTPAPPRKTVPELWGNLARPQPDSCIGYITADEATSRTPALHMPFTREEDEIADCVVHHANTHFPFLTAQWKSACFGESQVQASYQAARDGALIVNYMYQFYTLAYPNRAPSQLDTCHMSVTTEGYTITLWIHWREISTEDGQVYFRMEIVDAVHMSKVKDLQTVRGILHNYVEYALGQRLATIKTALPAFWLNPARKKPMSQPTGTDASSHLNFNVKLPTPSSSGTAGRPAKKSKRSLPEES